jgi:4a-hydroxytetrahydrobiopterin dehydratase
MDKVPEEEITRRLATLNGWRREGETITKTFELKDFTRAIGFVVQVGILAEAVWHHPDILIHGWNKVDVTCASHDAGTVTKRDLDLATKIEELLQD